MCVFSLGGASDGPEDAAVAEDDDEEGDEEDEGEQQHGVGAHQGGERHVVPRTGRQQALWNIRTCTRSHTHKHAHTHTHIHYSFSRSI